MTDVATEATDVATESAATSARTRDLDADTAA